MGEGRLLPQTPFAVLHAANGGLMLAHGDTLSHSEMEDELGSGLSYLWMLTRASPASVPAPPVVSEMENLAAAIGFDIGAVTVVPHKL